MLNPVNAQARFDAEVPLVAGRFVKDADATLIQELLRQGSPGRRHAVRALVPALLALQHSADLLGQAHLVRAHVALKDTLLAENEKIGWHPEHIRHGRFGDWLANNVDWALSRDRFWGTPIPVWRCTSCGKDTCVGSVAELSERAAVNLSDLDLHRPFVDDVEIACEHCGARAHRVEPVLDAWFDSGAMPRRAVALPVREPGALRASLPGRLHLRGDRPDPRLVLLAARGQHARLRPGAVPRRRLPRAAARPRRPEDVEEPGQRRRSVVGPHDPRRRRPALELRVRELTVDAQAGVAREHRRDHQPLPAHALEHLRLLRHVRQPRRLGPRRRRQLRAATTSWTAGSALASTPPSRGRRCARRLRRAARHPGPRRVRRRSLQLVRAPEPAPLLEGLGRQRPRGPARVPCVSHAAPRADLPVHGRRAVPEPLRAPIESVHLRDWPGGRRRPPSTRRSKPRWPSRASSSRSAWRPAPNPSSKSANRSRARSRSCPRVGR